MENVGNEDKRWQSECSGLRNILTADCYSPWKTVRLHWNSSLPIITVLGEFFLLKRFCWWDMAWCASCPSVWDLTTIMFVLRPELSLFHLRFRSIDSRWLSLGTFIMVLHITYLHLQHSSGEFLLLLLHLCNKVWHHGRVLGSSPLSLFLNGLNFKLALSLYWKF